MEKTKKKTNNSSVCCLKNPQKNSKISMFHTNMYCMIPFQLRQNIHWVCWLLLRIAAVLSVNWKCQLFTSWKEKYLTKLRVRSPSNWNKTQMHLFRDVRMSYSDRSNSDILCCVKRNCCVLWETGGVQSHLFIIDIYPSFQFRWESCLEFDWCAIAVVSLYKNFHVCWI